MKKPVDEKNRERYRKLSCRVSELRKNRGMSQKELCEKAGISPGT